MIFGGRERGLKVETAQITMVQPLTTPRRTGTKPTSRRCSEPFAGAAEVRESPVPAAFHGQRLDKVIVAMAPSFQRHLQSLIEQAM
jgi:hypothetical protein